MSRTLTFDRETILQNAMQLFWEKGYNATSMQDLVEATGLNRSSIYNTFGSKLDLYKASLSVYQKRTGKTLKEVLLKANRPSEALQKVFEMALREIVEDKEGRGCFNMNCKSEMGNQNLEIRHWLLGTQEEMLSLFESLVSQGQQEAEFNLDKSAQEYAYYLYSSFQGFRMTGILVKDRPVLEGIISNTLSVLK
ncbi:TetR/AcrR family transcriptional regulator [Lentiprolixibacter aurantiacus]|uniref:TetR/AcrR family transcriptional regulator n=1 Tax=Lentiprolixibacter aurantiacus TaxID=2993939 RepID=A0AAE3MK09_9FLAO|nr:TetR/AcrR family transcriptional regulator [Lentiprolixibacter aurantiacus]MCX2718746.1 TetR/AcrR family transcriptional regulator [Lentiprolixibacter aurantiacus]